MNYYLLGSFSLLVSGICGMIGVLDRNMEIYFGKKLGAFLLILSIVLILIGSVGILYGR